MVLLRIKESMLGLVKAFYGDIEHIPYQLFTGSVLNFYKPFQVVARC